MPGESSHLVERIAERLRGVGGLTALEPAPERDIRHAVRREAERRPLLRRAAPKPAPEMPAGDSAHGQAAPLPAAPDFGAESFADDAYPIPHDLTDGEEARGTAVVPTRRNVETTDNRADDPSRAVVDASQRSPTLTDPAQPFSMPDISGQPPVDMAALERAGLVVGHKVRTRISEEFRITVGHILRSMHTNYSPGRGAPNVLMVTSARPGEGKSFSSLNLAGSIAQHTQREVLLVDIDAKQRSMSVELGLGDRPGLLDLSTNTALRIEDVIVRTSIPHLSIDTIGSGHTIGTEISPTRPVTALVERIARRFPNAVVLLDAPPCLSTSDPSTLAPFVGQIVLVVEAERTQRNEVTASLDLIKACPSITLMLNKIRLTTSYTFGAYHYFGTYS
jgi:receptor protein-tyrosine kinase